MLIASKENKEEVKQEILSELANETRKGGRFSAAFQFRGVSCSSFDRLQTLSRASYPGYLLIKPYLHTHLVIINYRYRKF
ncbi:unnamed protein product [Hermetia illucens]|uniref:Uncharacterized protein n=1 Tax=Hermetia illucens TaxID=343691 RepID=A0A7R8V1G9_HERIL|nr:unnamed protein product [Hermetia illucens]